MFFVTKQCDYGRLVKMKILTTLQCDFGTKLVKSMEKFRLAKFL